MERIVEEKTTTKPAAAGAALLVLLGAATGVAPAGAAELSDFDETPLSAPESRAIAEASAGEARITSGDMTTGPLQNSAKRTYVGNDGGWWVDTVNSPQDVTYPTPGNTGIVQIGGTCISKITRPTDGSAPIVQTGDGSECMPFTAEITSEGFFTFRANSPGALDMSPTYAAVYAVTLPKAKQVVDAFHLVQLANRALDEVRRRVQREKTGHRGREKDPLFRARRVLLAGEEHLSQAGQDRLASLLRLGDPGGEVAIAHRVKERVREFYRCADLDLARNMLAELVEHCRRPVMPKEVRRLGSTLHRGLRRSGTITLPG